MSEPLVADMYAAVEWVDSPSEIDTTYTENVELVPGKTSQATVKPIYTENNVDLLFDIAPPATFAMFEPFKGYNTKLKRLFFRKVLYSFDPDTAIDSIDDLFEKGFEDEEGDSDQLFEMLNCLKQLNELLEEIILHILSTIRT